MVVSLRKGIIEKETNLDGVHIFIFSEKKNFHHQWGTNFLGLQISTLNLTDLLYF